MADSSNKDKDISSATKALLIGGVGFVGLLVIISAASGGKQSSQPEKAAAQVGIPMADLTQPKQAVVTPQADVTKQADVPQPSLLTGPQRNAARSAAQYVEMSGFSRKGLIGQLSSDAGDGYARADAEAAVDSLSIDWDEQAARSAAQYVEMSGFSCKGLIEQLSSSAGDQYTHAQARYGAEQAGAC